MTLLDIDKLARIPSKTSHADLSCPPHKQKPSQMSMSRMAGGHEMPEMDFGLLRGSRLSVGYLSLQTSFPWYYLWIIRH